MNHIELLEKIKKTLSLTELNCLKKLFTDIDLTGNEIIVNINQIKKDKDIGRSSLVSSLRLLEFADVLSVRSLGNKGSIIFIKKKEVIEGILK